ncbi:hypothetical protein B0H16DRAFT_1455030 [Mycena metata]|uniref:Uncharacterized protein n=1 Tax=Mycena metata TaxID=1033252 RepID=A0AAD7JH58_9AGAR|nr:hypothetical protein B0H16DRAFT_1455030 [Mycena metata]
MLFLTFILAAMAVASATATPLLADRGETSTMDLRSGWNTDWGVGVCGGKNLEGRCYFFNAPPFTCVTVGQGFYSSGSFTIRGDIPCALHTSPLRADDAAAPLGTPPYPACQYPCVVPPLEVSVDGSTPSRRGEHFPGPANFRPDSAKALPRTGSENQRARPKTGSGLKVLGTTAFLPGSTHIFNEEKASAHAGKNDGRECAHFARKVEPDDRERAKGRKGTPRDQTPVPPKHSHGATAARVRSLQFTPRLGTAPRLKLRARVLVKPVSIPLRNAKSMPDDSGSRKITSSVEARALASLAQAA